MLISKLSWLRRKDMGWERKLTYRSMAFISDSTIKLILLPFAGIPSYTSMLETLLTPLLSRNACVSMQKRGFSISISWCCKKTRCAISSFTAPPLLTICRFLLSVKFIDATKSGGIGRFANHSCNPNCYVAKWTVGTHVRMGIFAKRDIKLHEELTFNYNVDRYGCVWLRLCNFRLTGRK